MFESFTGKSEERRRRLSGLLFLSACMHGVVIAAVLFAEQMRVDPVIPPHQEIVYLDTITLPPPPMPPPAPSRPSAPRPDPVQPPSIKPEPKVPEFVAPARIPQAQPSLETKPAEKTNVATGKVKGDQTAIGTGNGVKGGVDGWDGQDEFPPSPSPEAEPPPPPEPTFQSQEIIRQRKIAGADPDYPRIALAAGLEAVVMVKIVIDADGRVKDLRFMKPNPQFEAAVEKAVRGWRFTPYLINGRPVETATVYKIVFKLE